MHNLLAIQLRKHLGLGTAQAVEAVLGDLQALAAHQEGPTARVLSNLGALLASTDSAYTQFDRDLALAHRSLVISNEELVALYQDQRLELERRQRALDMLRESALELAGEDQTDPGQDLERLSNLIRRLVREREEARHSLQQSERIHRHVVNSLQEIIFQTNPDHTLAFLNAAWPTITGFGLAECIGRPILDFVHPDDLEALKAGYRSLLDQSRDTLTMDARCRTRSGGWRWMRASLRLMAPMTNQPGTLGTLTDITEQKTAEAALLQAQKLESLGVLAGGIAHDFNNLLVSIRGNLELALLELDASHPAHIPLDRMTLAATRASEIVRQLLDFAGKGRLQFATFSLNETLASMEGLLCLPGRPGTAPLLEPAPEPLLLQGDPTQVRQALFNLVVNAADAMGSSPEPIRIRTGAAQLSHEDLLACQVQEGAPGTYVFLEVSDRGSGIDAETRRRIFDPFFSTKATGRGLGLAVIHGIIRNHQGAIRVEERAGGGTVFTLYFPATEAPATPPVQPPPLPQAGPCTILVVDDEAPNRMVLAGFLDHLGFRMVEAESGPRALSLLDRDPEAVDAVLLDLSMPGMDGGQTCLALRSRRPDLPVVIMSGYSEPQCRSQLDGQRIDGFLQKPFSIQDLHQILAKATTCTHQAH